ncbi:MAG: glucan biosynthesis protein D [Pirellula sp.]|nr:glucan biosynthesis protein D [Pirellula sp.]
MSRMSLITRRNLFKLLGLAAALKCAPRELLRAAEDRAGTTDQQPFSYETVRDAARLVAKQAYRAQSPLPKSLAKLNYDAYRLIAFRHEEALWRDDKLPFWTEFHHRGFVHRDQVDMFIVANGKAKSLPFDPRFFQYRGKLSDLHVSSDCGFAGLRFLCRLPEREHYQEFCSFQGASYFRAIPSHEVYGSSARGIAVDIGLPEPEEFPKFTKLWLDTPSSDSATMRMWALLDGPSVAGAYEFVITPGLKETTLDIRADLHFRRTVKKLGLGPLTSMWMWEGAGKPAGDHRPEVHDADGLLVASDSGEWLWRPLRNPKSVSVARYQFGGVRGFGLLQRERALDAYRDGEALYHLRPGIWMSPRESWKDGAVELLEIPSDTEANDNIAAYWCPDKPPQAGDSLTLDYRVACGSLEPASHVGARAVKTSVTARENGGTEIAIRWNAGTQRPWPLDLQIQPVVSTSVGEIRDVKLDASERDVRTVRFTLLREADRPAELRVFLRAGADALSETWSYLCN